MRPRSQPRRPSPPVLYDDAWLRDTWRNLDPTAPLAPQLANFGVPAGNVLRLRRRAEALGCDWGGSQGNDTNATRPSSGRWDIYDRMIALLEERHAQQWRHAAVCRDHSTRVFFPADNADVAQVKAICSGCPVADRCLAEHLTVRHGVFGGLTAAERRRRARDMNAA